MHSCGIVSASNGTRPVTSSYSTQPTAQMSARGSTSLALASCSGDMYSGEPIIELVWVKSGAAISCVGDTVLEMPKSSTFTSGEPS